MLDAAGGLLAVGAFCIGTSQIDLSAASARGIAVFNAPFSNTRSVVELALAEITALTRDLTGKNAGMHAGIWDKSAKGSHEVRGRRLGIVGYGNIGTQLSVLAENLGMTVFCYDVADKLALGNARPCASLGELLESVDVVSLHVDGRHGNERVVRRAGVRADAPRPPALEPVPRIRRRSRRVAGRDFLVDGATTLSVNMPALTLPAQAGAHRLLHVHHNVPGVLAAVDGILADHGVNIEGQLLGTRGDVGYVLPDIGCDYSAEVLTGLACLDATIRLRLLS